MKHHLVDRWHKLFKLIRMINSHLRRHGKPSDQRPKRQGMSFVVVVWGCSQANGSENVGGQINGHIIIPNGIKEAFSVKIN
ncbi:hypothetical protein ACE6H2_006800 [Prunus campanulata]